MAKSTINHHFQKQTVGLPEGILCFQGIRSGIGGVSRASHDILIPELNGYPSYVACSIS